MAAQLPADSHYLLPRDASESDRLNRQHYLIKTAFNEQLIPSNITLPENPSIFDSATGTTIWLQDFIKSHPGVHFANVMGCDISTDQFPSKSARKVGDVDVELLMHDVTKSFPESRQGTFDLVNQRLLVAGLKDGQWDPALENLASLLKPGGYLNIVEVLLHCEKSPAEVFKIVNKVFDTIAVLGNRVDCVTGAEDWMRAAGFEEVQVSRVKWRCGAGSEKGEAFGKGSAENVQSVIKGFWDKLSANAPQLLPEEIRSQEDGAKFHADVKKAFEDVGAVFTLGMVTGRKPSNQ